MALPSDSPWLGPEPVASASSGAPRYEIEAHTQENGISLVTCKTAPPLAVDTSAGQRPDRFGPAELLAAAFAACTLKNVERFSQLLAFRYVQATMRVVAERTDRPPRITGLRYVLRLTTDEPPHRVDLLRRNLVRFGTVYNTLAPAVEIRGEIAVESTPLTGGPLSRPPRRSRESRARG